MTDARFPDRWLHDRRIMRLPAEAFRTFVCSLAWAASNRTDGYIEKDDLDLIPGGRLNSEQLEFSGLWRVHDNGWIITDYEETQTSSEQLDAAALARRREIDKKRQQRRRALLSRDSHVTVQGDNSRTGQARLGSSVQVVDANGYYGSEQKNSYEGDSR